MKQVFVAILALLLTLNLAGCSTNTQKENMTAGAVAGALIGGGAGAFIGQGVGTAVAVGVGIVGGALIGGYIGDHMDSSDNAKMNASMNNPTNKRTDWKNDKTGASYSMAPTSKVMAINGNGACRTFHTKATIEGKTQEVDGTACRQTDGTWKSIKT
ncbi:MAG TPA: RT0821/Lpp0805 family surface protein [Gammaproteobacteria bacterium]|nr:RT0821/Lpp0805 family surface protein [Gammaproteobacteria bacterium]